MPVPLLDLEPQYAPIADRIHAAVDEVIRSQRFILGPAVERFEREAAGYLAVRHAIGCASGTDALLLALRALQLEPGDEVVVPSFTFFATAGAVWNAGLRPVFAEIDPVSFNVTAETVAAVLSDRTRAVVPVHLFGQMAPMAPILELAQRHGLAVIEDAAQAFGARQSVYGEWRHAGTLASMGCYSFFPSKNLGGFGDGGMVATSDDALADRVGKLRVHGGRRMYHHEMVGTNSRLDALQAAILSVKLAALQGWIADRRRVAESYNERLAGLAPHVSVPETLPGNEHCWNYYTLRVQGRDELKARLDEAGIGNAIYYPVPLHLQPCFAALGYREGDLPETERATAEAISLPIYPGLTAAQIAEVVAAIQQFFAD